MNKKQVKNICVITHPLGEAGENATRSLLDILSNITNVSLVTADLPADSVIRQRHEVVEFATQEPSDSILRAAVQFVYNQLKMCRTIVRRDEEIMLFFGATAYLLPILFSRLLGKNVILEPRGNVSLTLRLNWEQSVPAPVARMLAGGVWFLEQVGYWLSDGIITYTPSMAKELGLQRFENKLYPTGARYVDTEQFYPRTPFEERDTVVGFLGRLDEEKNVRTLAKAVDHLTKKTTFRFIGDGPLRGELEQKLVDERMTGQVEFTGWVDHNTVPRELSQLRLLVLPSEPTEGLPTVILEAMACGTPVLAAPVSGVPDVIQDGKTGFLFSEYSPEQTAKLIRDILFKKDLTTISATGIKRINEEYTMNAAVERYRVILSEL